MSAFSRVSESWYLEHPDGEDADWYDMLDRADRQHELEHGPELPGRWATWREREPDIDSKTHGNDYAREVNGG